MMVAIPFATLASLSRMQSQGEYTMRCLVPVVLILGLICHTGFPPVAAAESFEPPPTVTIPAGTFAMGDQTAGQEVAWHRDVDEDGAGPVRAQHPAQRTQEEKPLRKYGYSDSEIPDISRQFA